MFVVKESWSPAGKAPPFWGIFRAHPLHFIPETWSGISDTYQKVQAGIKTHLSLPTSRRDPFAHPIIVLRPVAGIFIRISKIFAKLTFRDAAGLIFLWRFQCPGRPR